MASSSKMRYLPFSAATTPLQAATYLLGISLFSISFLVFLNSSVSFVITDRIGVREGVGDIVGTLGFVDELVALVACPAWGLVSDRLGVRLVAVIGYAIIALSLVVFVQARNVYPQLLLARILFALGATAAATMVTAILPSLTDDSEPTVGDACGGRKVARNARNSVVLSMDSELTITPERFQQTQPSTPGAGEESAVVTAPEETGKSSVLAGYVGLFTGCGALVALVLFLPLPSQFGRIAGVTLGDAVAYGFYVVGAVALLVAVFVFVGLRNLKGEEGKGWKVLLGLSDGSETQGRDEDGYFLPRRKILPYWRLLKESILLGFTDHQIGLGYLGGFVARASTVAISLFIPLYVNAFFINNGFCHGSPTDPSPELKKECRQAYLVSAILTGVAQLVGLVCAPLFGYFSRRRGRVNISILVATTFGIAGYVAFPALQSPEPKDLQGRGGSPVVFLVVALIGISQIGAIVCSLGSLGRGVLAAELRKPSAAQDGSENDTAVVHDDEDQQGEAAPLMRNGGGGEADEVQGISRVQLKGSIAGVYSWYGGAAILLLTKLGGYLFDSWTMGAPFYMMAIFNGILLVESLGIDIALSLRR